MQSKPDFSVLMAVYNGEKYLEQAIESVLKQTLKNFELIIINDGSKDNSAQILEKFAMQDKRCRVISRPNKGLHETRKELISESSSELIAWLDQDDLFHPTKLERQLSYINQHPECVVLASEGLLIDEDGDFICTFFKSQSHEKIDQDHISGLGTQICFPSLVVKKSVFLQVGGIRKQFEYSDDLDLYLRMAEVGKIVILPEVLVSYRQHLESVGYARREKQIKDAQGAVNDARQRRGLAPLDFSVLQVDKDYDSNAEIYTKWVWWSLSDRYFKTATKYALKVVKNQPFEYKSYHLLMSVFKKRFFI